MRSLEEIIDGNTPPLYEEYQRIYFYEGFDELLKQLLYWYGDCPEEHINKLIQGILYGYNKKGEPFSKPRIPDPYLMTTDEFLYDFQCRIWKNYVAQETQKQNKEK